MRYLPFGEGCHDPMPVHAALGLTEVTVLWGPQAPGEEECDSPLHHCAKVYFRLSDGREGIFDYATVCVGAALRSEVHEDWLA
jgi:hypothetical protein